MVEGRPWPSASGCSYRGLVGRGDRSRVSPFATVHVGRWCFELSLLLKQHKRRRKAKSCLNPNAPPHPCTNFCLFCEGSRLCQGDTETDREDTVGTEQQQSSHSYRDVIGSRLTIYTSDRPTILWSPLVRILAKEISRFKSWLNVSGRDHTQKMGHEAAQGACSFFSSWDSMAPCLHCSSLLFPFNTNHAIVAWT